MKYIPSWFPGAYFHKVAAHSKNLFAVIVNRPFQTVKDQLSSGIANSSIAASMLERAAEANSGREEAETVSKNATALAYTAGADTTVATVQAFILAMILYPEVQRKAQDELAAVVGPNRLPTFEDRDSLPYVEAVATEALRWHLVLPLGLPHYTTEEDEYRGYRIPKGAIVMGNAWAILNDPFEYPDPQEFQPERFLKDGRINPDVQDPFVAAFGYGRRICPGRHLARNSLFIMVASILHAFRITNARDESGKIIPVEPDVTSGTISYPVPYQYSIKPRSATAAALIAGSNEES